MRMLPMLGGVLMALGLGVWVICVSFNCEHPERWTKFILIPGFIGCLMILFGMYGGAT